MPTYNGTSGNDNIRGSSSDDNISGGAGDDTLDGAAGNDLIIGGDGNDVIVGSEGQDTLLGGNGNDVMWGGGYSNLGFPNPDQVRDDLDGGEGNDSFLIGTLDVALGGNGDDRFELEPTGTSAFRASMDGGAGTDFADFGFINYRATIHLDPTSVPVDGFTLRNIELVALGDFGSRVVGGALSDFVIGGNGIDEMDGGAGDDVLGGEGGADTLNGGAGNDLLDGGAGNDVLRGGLGNDLLDGGTGFDIAAYSGVRRQYGASINSVAGGPEGGTDTLVSIEELRFVDGALSFDVNGIAAQVMRLYDATLDRQPDQAGLDVQIRALSSGAATLQSLADGFVGSAEFQSRYGALSNQQFVEQLYRFSLDREGDAAGIALQVNALNTGTSRAALVVGFSESAEHRLLTQPILNAGLWVASDKALQIARLYDATFDRLPDAAGLAAQIAALDSGVSLLTIAAGFAASAEFQARYGALSNQAFVEQLYRFCLNREGDATGIALQVNALNTGTSRAQLLLGFSESAEHVSLTAPLFSGGIRTVDPAFSGTPVEADVGGKADDQPQTLVPADEAMTLDTGPQVLIPADDASAKGRGFDVAQTHPGLVLYDPADIVIDFKPIDDAFVLPGLDDLSPLVLPDVEAIDRDLLAIDLVGMVPTGDTMLTLAVEDGWSAESAPAFRTGHDDGWMMQ